MSGISSALELLVNGLELRPLPVLKLLPLLLLFRPRNGGGGEGCPMGLSSDNDRYPEAIKGCPSLNEVIVELRASSYDGGAIRGWKRMKCNVMWYVHWRWHNVTTLYLFWVFRYTKSLRAQYFKFHFSKTVKMSPFFSVVIDVRHKLNLTSYYFFFLFFQTNKKLRMYSPLLSLACMQEL